MVRLTSAAAVAAAATLVAGQDNTPTPLPDVSAPAGMACGGCYVVADVAGIVFGGVATSTQTNVVVTGNGTQVVTLQSTSVIENQGKATFTNGAPVGPGVVTSFNSLGSVITVGGATLTSPTQYEVFTAYSVMSTVSAGSGCSVSSGTPSTLSVASKYTIPPNAPSDYLLNIESQFIKAIGFPECSAGGSNVQSTVHSQVTTTTASITTNSAPPSAAAASTSAPASASSTYMVPNATLQTSFPTITPAAGGAEHVAAWGSATALVVAVAVLAVWL